MSKKKRDPNLPENLVPASSVPLSRREFLKGASVAGLSVSLGWFLAACQSAAQPTTAPATSAPQPTSAPAVQGATAAERAVNGAKALNLPSGSKLTVLFPSGTRDQIEPAAKEWTALTGIQIELAELPQVEQLKRVTQEGVARTGGWDIADVWPKMMADLVSAGSIIDMTDYAAKYNPDLTGIDARVVEPLVGAVMFKGRLYAMPIDGDSVVSFARKDLWEDAKNKQDFEAKYGYPLAAPATWAEYRDMAEFFHNRTPGLAGCIELRNTQYGYIFFQARWCSKALPFAYWFDDDMKPLANSPEAIAAGKEYVELAKFMNPDIPNWSFNETYGGWANGDAALGLGWPSQIKVANIPDLSKIVGKQLNFRLPGSKVGDQINYRNFQSAGNAWTVNAYSKGNKEAAYLFTQYHADPGVSAKWLTGGGFYDPFRYNHFTDPGVVSLYTEGQMGLNGPLAEDMRVMAPDIILKGSDQYSESLARNINAAFVGQMSVEEALNKTASEWDAITERQGRAGQIEAWRQLKATAYPKV
jgi:multiple sugar transport system substrate-binding protein